MPIVTYQPPTNSIVHQAIAIGVDWVLDHGFSPEQSARFVVELHSFCTPHAQIDRCLPLLEVEGLAAAIREAIRR
jgi:hypothetical protein